MHQIKIFKALESELPSLEKQVNEFLKLSKARIISIKGSVAPQSCPADDKNNSISKSAFAPSDILIIVHFEVSPT